MDISVIAIHKMFSYMQSELAPYFLKLVCTGLVRLYLANHDSYLLAIIFLAC